MSCVDEGHGPAVVMVHGNPSWSYLYRRVITALSGRYRCVAPDHIGCGLSDKPQQYPYTLSQHIDNLEALLEERDIQRCLLMVHDWGGAIGMGWAGRHPDRVAGIVVTNTAAFPMPYIPLRLSVCRVPGLGALLVRGLNGFARPSVQMAVTTPLTAERAAGFLAPYRSWHDRVALYRFVRDIPMNSRHPSWATLKEVEAGLAGLEDCPMLLCWGGRDFCFNEVFFAEWRRRFPDAQTLYCKDAGHYVLEDAFAEAMGVITPFVERCLGC